MKAFVQKSSYDHSEKEQQSKDGMAFRELKMEALMEASHGNLLVSTTAALQVILSDQVKKAMTILH